MSIKSLAQCLGLFKRRLRSRIRRSRVARGARRAWNSSPSRRIRRWSGRPLGVAAIGAVLALTFDGLVHPANAIKGIGKDIAGLFSSGPSTAELQVGRLYDSLEHPSAFWNGFPMPSRGSRRFLVKNWNRFTPYRAHPFSVVGARVVRLSELYEDNSIDGTAVAFSATVTQVLGSYPSPHSKGAIYERYRLSMSGDSDVAWCGSTLPRGDTVRTDDQVRVVGVPYARGSANLAGGGFQNGTALVCPGIQRDPPDPKAAAVDQLYGTETKDPFWTSPPNLSASRDVLIKNWDSLDPYIPHASFPLPARRVSPDPLFVDYSLDGRAVYVVAYINEVLRVDPSRTDAHYATTFFGLAVGGQSRVVWCVTTAPKNSMRVNDLVTAYGVVIARGSSALSRGGFDNGSFMVCPVVRPGYHPPPA
jgi:hypothetical protein